MVPQALLMQISILPSAGLVPPTSLSVSSVQLPAGVEASAQMHTLMVQTVSMFVLSQSTLQYALAIIIISVELEILVLQILCSLWQTTPASSFKPQFSIRLLWEQLSRSVSEPVHWTPLTVGDWEESLKIALKNFSYIEWWIILYYSLAEYWDCRLYVVHMNFYLYAITEQYTEM